MMIGMEKILLTVVMPGDYFLDRVLLTFRYAGFGFGFRMHLTELVDWNGM